MKIEETLSQKERRDLLSDHGISHICTIDDSAQSSNSLIHDGSRVCRIGV